MKLTKLALITGLTFSATALSEKSSFAAEIDGGTMNSKASIIFEKNTDPTNPVDPTNPTNPVKPEKPDEHEKGTSGPLSIDYVSNFQFNTQKASGKDEVYTAQLDKVIQSKDGTVIEVPNYIQVTDNRGTNAGWNLTVKQNAQFKTTDRKELTGASLTLKNGHLNSATNNNAPTTEQNIQLTPGVASDVINAKAEQGMGIWTNAFGKSNNEAKKSIELTVPGKTKKEQTEYTTSLTWELKDTPL